MVIHREECLFVGERAVVVNLCDGRGQRVRVEVTAGSLASPHGAAHAAELEPGVFCRVGGDLVHRPPRAGAWGLAFRVLANNSHYQDLCSLFVTGYSEEQRVANGCKPYTTATVLPIGCTEVVRETPGEGVVWAFPPADSCLFHVHLQLGTLKTQNGEVTYAGAPREPADPDAAARVFPRSQSIRIGMPVSLILRLEVV